MRKIDKIVVHCAYTPPDMDIGAEEIRRWHVDGNGWSDIGYHYVIRRDGTVEEGRGLETPGAHVRGHNNNSIGICLVGGKRDGEADFNFTYSQLFELAFLVEQLREIYPGARILGHRDLDAGKECPCFDVEAFFS